MPSNDYAHMARNRKAVRLIAVLQENTALAIRQPLDPYGKDATTLLYVASNASEALWTELATKANVSSPSESTVKFIKFLLTERVKMVERLTV